MGQLSRDVVHGTIQRTVYVSNGRPLQYQDPADQIRAKAGAPLSLSLFLVILFHC
jgi:hypothetical protein